MKLQEIRKKYLAHQITSETANDNLCEVGMRPDAADNLLALWCAAERAACVGERPREQIDMALEELRKMQWVSGLHHFPTCSWCGNMKRHGHKQSCHLGRAIELLDAAGTGVGEEEEQ